MLRQSGASEGVVMSDISIRSHRRVSTLPENVLQHYNPRPKRNDREKRQWLIRGWCGRRRAPIVDKLKPGEVTPLDLLDVLEKRIAEVDGKVNALPTLCFDRARDHAKALMQKPAGERGLLAGLPVPIKDLTASRAC